VSACTLSALGSHQDPRPTNSKAYQCQLAPCSATGLCADKRSSESSKQKKCRSSCCETTRLQTTTTAKRATISTVHRVERRQQSRHTHTHTHRGFYQTTRKWKTAPYNLPRPHNTTLLHKFYLVWLWGKIRVGEYTPTQCLPTHLPHGLVYKQRSEDLANDLDLHHSFVRK